MSTTNGRNGAGACCPTCGRRWPAAKRTSTAVPVPAGTCTAVDLAAMPDSDVFAYYKRTAPAADFAFFLRARMSPALRAFAEALGPAPKPPILAELRGMWRREREYRHRSPASSIGAPEWHKRAQRRADKLIADGARVGRCAPLSRSIRQQLIKIEGSTLLP